MERTKKLITEKVIDELKIILENDVQELKNSESLKVMNAALAGVCEKAADGDIKALDWIIAKINESENDEINALNEELKEREILNAGLPARLVGSNFSDIYRDILARKYRYYNFKGGRGSLKSSFCALVLVDEIMRNDNFCAAALRQIKDTIKDSVYSQIIWAIDILGLTEEFECVQSPLQIKRKSTGQKIYFRGCDDPIKIKSIRPPKNMYIGVVWFEEKDQLAGSEIERNILQSLVRGGDDIIILSSYNTPISTNHWLNIRERERENINLNDNYNNSEVYHTSCYKNTPKEWLGNAFIENAEKLERENNKAYRHEYLGEAIGLGGQVFENVKINEDFNDSLINESLKNMFDKFYYGVDWGFYPDPFIYIKCAYNANKRELYILDELCEYKKSNRETAEILLREKKLTNHDLIICDSAEPKSIAEYKNAGLYAIGAEKGAGSVDFGIKWLQKLNAIIISPKCKTAVREFCTYEYERNKDGEVISAYPDKDNHAIDAVRYAMSFVLGREK